MSAVGVHFVVGGSPFDFAWWLASIAGIALEVDEVAVSGPLAHRYDVFVVADAAEASALREAAYLVERSPSSGA